MTLEYQIKSDIIKKKKLKNLRTLEWCKKQSLKAMEDIKLPLLERWLLLLFTPLEFFISVLADGFSLEFEWQQVSSSLQDSSQYSGHSQQCCHLDSLFPSTNFQVIQSSIILWLLCQKHQSQLAQSSLSCSTAFFNSLARSRYLSFFSHSFRFILWSAGTAKSTLLQFLFFCWLL